MKTIACLLISTTLLLAACAKENRLNIVDKLPFIYRIDIQQGNLITQEMVDQLELGMAPEQVAYIMGTPMLDNLFDENEIYYYYSFQPGGKDREEEILILSFVERELIEINQIGEIPDAIPQDTHPRENILIDDSAIL